jgi:iron complex outermembrane receptor protein
LGATYFYNNIKNMIATYSVTNPAGIPSAVTGLCGAAAGTTSGGAVKFANCAGGASFYSNDQNGRANGWELTGKWAASPTVTLNAMYTFTNTFLTSTWNGVTTPLDQQIAGVPKQLASLGVTWTPISQLRTYFEVFYIGQLYYAQGSTLPQTQPFSQASNTIFNLSGSYKISQNTEAFAKIINLLNKQYQDGTYTGGAPYAQTLSMPLTLNAGIRVRF